MLIVLQTPRDEQSSVFIASRALADELDRRGHSAMILTPGDVRARPRSRGRWTPLLFPIAVARWLRQRRSEYDVALFHSYAGWLAAAIRAAPETVAVVAFHGLEPLYHEELREEMRAGGLSWRYRFLQERFMPFALGSACRKAALVLCLNTVERREIVARGWAPEDRVRTFAHGVPDELFDVRRDERPVRSLLFIGQWLPMKGTAYLVAAFDRLAARHSDLHLVCAGTIAEADTVRSAFGPAIRERVTVVPRADRATLLGCYRDADVFVFPSLYEGFGVALLEAMASGLPIVSTPVGVAADALRHETSVLFIGKRDTAATAASVERLMAQPQLRATLGAEARKAALAYREPDRIRELADWLVALAPGASSLP